MNDHVSVVNHNPALTSFTLDFALFSMRLVHGFYGGVCKGIKHAIAGAGTQNEIVGERCNVFYIEQENVLAFFIFE